MPAGNTLWQDALASVLSREQPTGGVSEPRRWIAGNWKMNSTTTRRRAGKDKYYNRVDVAVIPAKPIDLRSVQTLVDDTLRLTYGARHHMTPASSYG